jgi:hypothetical protein
MSLDSNFYIPFWNLHAGECVSSDLIHNLPPNDSSIGARKRYKIGRRPPVKLDGILRDAKGQIINKPSLSQISPA